MKARFFDALCAMLLTFAVSPSVDAALVSRLNGQAVYDTDLDVTWLADANLAASNTFGVSGIGNAIFPGAMTFYTAQDWIAAMNAANYLGYSDWRLPSSDGCTGTGCNTANNPLGHLYSIELGGTAPNSILASTDPDMALFKNFENTSYWIDYWDVTFGVSVLGFDFSDGRQQYYSPTAGYNVLALRPGDVAATPIPAAEWLFGSGLLGVFGLARRRPVK